MIFPKNLPAFDEPVRLGRRGQGEHAIDLGLQNALFEPMVDIRRIFSEFRRSGIGHGITV